MTVTDPSPASLLELVGFSPSELAHPVDLLTVEMAAIEAGVSVTTVHSAIASAAAFRDLVLQAAIRSVETRPNGEVWAALQRTVSRPVDMIGLSDVLHARVRQLAADPAFPLLLSGFERLDTPETATAVNETLRAVVVDFWPFIQTVRASAGRSVPPNPSEDVLFGSVLCLLGEAVRQVIAPADRPETDYAFAELLTQFVENIIDSPAALFADGSLLPGQTGESSVTHRAAQNAVNAGVRLLRSNVIEPATSLTVADASARCELSTASFYRVFGSMAEFEGQLLEQVGGSLADSFDDHFFSGDLQQIEAAGSRRLNIEKLLAAYYSQAAVRHQHHADVGRPGVELLPWLNSPVLGPLVRSSYRKRFEKRGQFFARLAETLGAELPDGLAAGPLASFMGVSSMAIEFLLRNAPDGAAADAYLVTRSEQFFDTIFVRRSGD